MDGDIIELVIRKREIEEELMDLEHTEETLFLSKDQIMKKNLLKSELLGILEEEELY
jgi:hypothetical protein